MPIVQIQLIEGRPDEKIKAVIANVTETMVETLGVKKEQVRVIVNIVPKSHFGIGGVPVSDLPGR